MGVASGNFSSLPEIPFVLLAILYLKACVGEQLFETKTAEFFSPISAVLPARPRAPKIPVKGAPSNFEGKSGFGCRGRRDTESSSFAHIFLASRLVNILSSLSCAAPHPPRWSGHYSLSLFSRSSSSLFAHWRAQLPRGIAPVCVHFNCARHRAISR